MKSNKYIDSLVSKIIKNEEITGHMKGPVYNGIQQVKLFHPITLTEMIIILGNTYCNSPDEFDYDIIIGELSRELHEGRYGFILVPINEIDEKGNILKQFSLTDIRGNWLGFLEVYHKYITPNILLNISRRLQFKSWD